MREIASQEELPRVSVITITLNSVSYLRDAIESVISQTYPAIEYLVIDGGSTDGTLDIIRRNEDRIDYWVSEPDKGLYHAMNKGVASSSGEILFFLNSDDRFADPAVVESVMEMFREDGDLDMVYGNALLDYPDGAVRWMSPPVLSRKRLATGTICHQAIFVKRRVMERTGGFSEHLKIVSDYEWLLKLAHAGINSRYIERDIALQGTEGLSRSTAWEDERLAVMRDYYSPAEILFWRILPRRVGMLRRRVRDLLRGWRRQGTR